MRARSSRFWLRLLGLATLAVLLLPVSCTWPKYRGPDLGQIYNRAARNRHLDRNPVIVIPGIMGSNLIDERGTVVWGSFGRKSADPSKPAGARLVALPMRQGVPLHELTDGVRPDGVMKHLTFNVLGLPIQLRAYHDILTTLGAGGYRDEDLGRSGAIDYGEGHFTCFQFAYDWRRDLSETAAELARFIEEKREYVRAERERRYGVSDAQIQFDIVAHSMGGLLTRYYMRYGGTRLPEDGSLPPLDWSGARNLENVILVAPPNAGSIAAVENLVLGVKPGPTVPRYQAAVIGSMPSTYQTLPRGRHGAVVDAQDPGRAFEDLYDLDLWVEQGWGLASAKQEKMLAWLLPGIPDAGVRREVALDHLRKSLNRARQFSAALDLPARPPEGVSLFLMVGDAIPTPAVVAADRRSGSLKIVERRPGDNVVLRTSALMDERVNGVWSAGLVSPVAWSHVTFISRKHLQMTRDPAFADNVLFVLLER